jgi:hypothetical protein
MPPDFRVFEVLNRHAVPFVVIGGHAVNFHGHQRSTDDTDIIWVRNATSSAALLAALEELHAQYIGNDIDPNTGIERTHPVTSGYLETHHLMMLWTDLGWVEPVRLRPGRAAGRSCRRVRERGRVPRATVRVSRVAAADEAHGRPVEGPAGPGGTREAARTSTAARRGGRRMMAATRGYPPSLARASERTSRDR